jgi:serine protease inhibitor ecotin
MKTTALLLALLVFPVLALAAAAPGSAGDPHMKAFPPAEAGMTRYVIALPA